MGILKKSGNSVIHYVMRGPQAIENRLVQLDQELEQVKGRIAKAAQLASQAGVWGFKLHRKGWRIPGKVANFCARKVVPELMELGSRTIEEILAERQALHSFLGGQLRAWEIKKSGPAPLA